jgi:hypothetical protein
VTLSLDTSVSTFAGALSSGSANGAPGVARFFLPIGITTDGVNLYVADSNNHTIRKVVIATGQVSLLAGAAGLNAFVNAPTGPGTVARFDTPQGITTDGTSLYVADTNNHAIRKVVISTGVVTTLAGDGSQGSQDSPGTVQFASPGGITTDGTYLFVADTNNHAIRKVNKVSGFTETIAGASPDIVPDSPDFLDDATGTNARFDSPQGITTDGTNLYVTDTNNFRIRKISMTAPYGVSTLAGTGTPGIADGDGLLSAEFATPIGITTDGANLYVADALSHTIRKVNKVSGFTETIAGDASAFDSPGYVDTTFPALLTDARFNTPEGVTTDGTKLYVIRAIE